MDQSDELSDRSVIAVQVEEAVDADSADELIDGVVTAARLLDLPQVHVWADGESLPLLAVAAGEIDELPEGFQLRQLDAETEFDGEEAGATWLTYDSLVQLARSRRSSATAPAA